MERISKHAYQQIVKGFSCMREEKTRRVLSGEFSSPPSRITTHKGVNESRGPASCLRQRRGFSYQILIYLHSHFTYPSIDLIRITVFLCVISGGRIYSVGNRARTPCTRRNSRPWYRFWCWLYVCFLTKPLFHSPFLFLAIIWI